MALSNEQRISFAVDYKVDTTSLQNARKSLQELQKMSLETFDSIGNNRYAANSARELSLLKQNASELEQALARSFNADLGVTNVQRLRNELSRLPMRDIGERFAMAGAAGQNAFNSVVGQALNLNNTLKQTGPILTKIQQTLTNALSWNLVTGAFNQITKSISQAWGYSKNLDNSLNNIRIITRQSAEEMERFAQTAQKTAKGLGQGTVDYTDAALIYYQQGLSDEEVAKKTETTLKTANVTGKSAADVSQLLTAVWNGYKVDANEAELYVDKLAAVASTTAADLGELSTAMSKVASVASTTGVDVDQLNAQISTIISVTKQAPESVGTALKTIYSRIGDLQVDGVDEFGVSLGKISSKLKTMGVDILDKNGDMREMGVVFEEVADKWANWTSAQKQAAAVALGGSRQYTNLFALFENWGDYERTLVTSSNAMGTLQEQQDIYSERLTAHLQELRTAWEGVYDSAFDEKAVVKIVDKLTSVVEIIEKFFDTVGGGLPVIKLLGSMLLSTFSTKIAAGFTNFIENSLISLRNFTDQQGRAQRQVENMMRNLGVQNQNFSQYQITSLADTSRMFRSRQDVITEDELNRVNQSMERTIQLENQMNTNAEEVRRTRTFLQGLGMVFDDGMSLQQNLDQVGSQLSGINYGRDFENRRQMFSQIASGRRTDFGQLGANYSQEVAAILTSQRQVDAITESVNARRIARGDAELTSDEVQDAYLTNTRTGLQFLGEQINGVATTLREVVQQEAGASVSRVGPAQQHVDRTFQDQNRQDTYDTQITQNLADANLRDRQYEILREGAQLLNPTPNANPNQNIAASRAEATRLAVRRNALINLYQHGGVNVVTQQQQPGEDQLREDVRQLLVTDLGRILQDAETQLNEAGRDLAQANTRYQAADRAYRQAQQSGDQAAIQQTHQDFVAAGNDLLTANQAHADAEQERNRVRDLHTLANAGDMNSFTTLYNADPQLQATTDAVNRYQELDNLVVTSTQEATVRITEEYNRRIQAQNQVTRDLRTRASELRTEYDNISQAVADHTERLTGNQVAVQTLDQAIGAQRQNYQDFGGDIANSTDEFIQNSEAIQTNVSNYAALGQKLLKDRNIFEQMNAYGMISDTDYEDIRDQINNVIDDTGRLTVDIHALPGDISGIERTIAEVLQRTGMSYEQAEQTIAQAREQQLDSARAELQQITAGQQELMRTLNMRQVIQTTTQLATGMTSLASSATMFKNAWTNIMSNDDLSAWEKMAQLLGSVGPMLIGMAPQIKNLGSIFVKGATGLWQLHGAYQAATTAIEDNAAAMLRGNFTEEQRAIAQARHISLTGRQITIQQAETIATEQQGAAMKRYAEVSALAVNAVLIAAAIAIGLIVAKWSEMKDAQEEAEKSLEKLSETAQEVVKKNKELRETVEDNAKAFDEWEDLWESFKKGKVAVDDVKTSMEKLIDQFGYSDDLEYQRLLRIAEYTQDYSELERKLDDIISKQKQVASGTYASNAQVSTEAMRGQLLDALTNDTFGTFGYYVFDDAVSSNQARKVNELIGVDDFFDVKKGFFGLTSTLKFNKDLTDEQLKAAIANLPAIKAESENAEGYYAGWLKDTLIPALEAQQQRLDFINQSELQSIIEEVTANKENFEISGETEQEKSSNIEKQISDTVDAILDQYDKSVSSKQYQEIQEQVRNSFLDFFPEEKEIINKSDALTNTWLQVLNKSAQQLKEDGIFSSSPLSQSSMWSLDEQLKAAGTDSKDIDWSGVANDTELLMNIFKEDGEWTNETLKAIAEHLTEAAQTTRELTADFDALGATWDDVNKKLEKNSLTDRNLRSNKEFQSLIDDDTIEQIRTFYGATSDVGKAIDIITNEDISSSSQRWKEAWKVYGEAIKNADIEQSLQNIEEKAEKLGDIKKGEINIQADAYDYYEVMDDILAEDYDIDVNIHGRIDAELENIKSDLDDSVKLVTKIGEGFTLSANELNDFADEMPEILDEMQVLSDGSIQLSQTAVESAKKAAIEKANEEIDGEIQVIKAQRAVVEHKKETVEEMLKIANKMAKGEYKTEDALKKAQTKLNEQALDLEKDDKVQAAIAEGKLQKDQLTKLASYYEAGLKQTAQYVTQRNKILEDFNLKETNYKIDTFAEDLGLDLYKTEFYQWEGTGAIRERLAQESIDNQIELGRHLQEVLNAQKDEYQSIIDSYNTDIKVMEAYKKNYQATWDAAGKATDKNTDSKDKNKDATDKQSAAEAKLIDLLEEEIDAYHDINILIKELDTNLSRLQKQQSKLYGKDLIDNLKQQGELLDQQIGNYEEKIRLSQMELTVTKQRLQAEGVQFNADGTVSNYSAAMQKKIDYIRDLQAQYNAMSAEDQENFKDTLDKAEKAYDKFKEDMEKYDQLLTEDIPELEDQIQDAIDSQIELKISAFETEVQLKLDTTEAEKNMREFRRKVIDQLQDDDILGNALADYADLSYYRNEQGLGVVQIYTDQLSAINQAIAEIESTGWSERFGDNINAAKEAQKEAQDNLRQALIDEQDAIKNIKDAYLSMIDKAQEKWDEQIESYNKLSNLINHDMNIIKLLYGEDKSYAMLDQYYKKQNEYNQQQLDMYIKQAAIWKTRMEEAADDPELYKKFKENWEKAIEGGKSVLESSIQGIIDTYTNAINEIFKELEDKITNGLGFDELKNDWDFINEESDRYLDSINGAYEISKLEKEMKDKIDNTSDLATQQKLTASMNEQLDALKQRDKLTQYDLDRANALFDIEVKRAAFKDAQQNKSRMRLRRDSQGNYSYQFVSDEDSVAQAAQELAEAQNSLYNLDKNTYKNNLDEIYNIYYEYNQKVQELYKDTTLAQDEKERRYYELTERYQESLVGLTQQHEQLKLNLKDSAFQELAKMYGKDVEEYQKMSDQEQEILMNQTVPMWGSAMDLMADAIGEQGLMGITKDAFQQLQSAVNDYDSAIEEVTEKAGDYFKDIEAGEDLIVTAMEEMIPVNDVVITQWAEMTDRMKDLALSAVVFADGLSAISQNAFAALEGSRLYDEYQQEKAQEQAKTNAEKKVDNAMSNSKDTTRGLDYNRDDWGAGNFPKIGDKVTYLGDYYFYDSLGTAPLGNRGEGQNKTVTVQNVAPNNPFPVAVMSNDSAYGWLKKYQIAKMDTGGYTGNWGSSDGKIGILHQKELVLNAYDTENFLKAMEIIEGMLSTNTLSTKMINNMNNKIFDVGELMTEYTSALTKMQEDMTQTIQQTVNVDAQFPNARDAEEILLAFENLSNKMTQYAHSTKR